jgi:phenylalanyl-tRNA synthetase alpha chain
MTTQLTDLVQRAQDDLTASPDLDSLEAWRLKYLGRRGELTQVLRSIGHLSDDERRATGQAANKARDELNAALEMRHSALQPGAGVDAIDVTMPGYPPRIGSIHPITRVMRDIRQALAPLGFRAVGGPEVETDHYNFELLNIPADHPARDMWDTFHVDDPARPGELLLRTHTSPVQARVMETMQPPVRVIVPGKVYRYEDRDASHESEFHQVEGLAVDKHITMADLRGTLTYLVRALFGAERQLRIRASYFPFTEPSAEAEMSCHVCDGSGCRTCGGNGWIEILGAGMVHPRVLAGVGYDPDLHQGFAFGMGVERIAMLKYGVPDVRMFYDNDLRMLRQLR